MAVAVTEPSELSRSGRSTTASLTPHGAVVTTQTTGSTALACAALSDGLRGRSAACADTGREKTLAGPRSLLRLCGAFPGRALSDGRHCDGSALSGSSVPAVHQPRRRRGDRGQSCLLSSALGIRIVASGRCAPAIRDGHFSAADGPKFAPYLTGSCVGTGSVRFGGSLRDVTSSVSNAKAPMLASAPITSALTKRTA
jgi:hypothetical protein